MTRLRAQPLSRIILSRKILKRVGGSRHTCRPPTEFLKQSPVLPLNKLDGHECSVSIGGRHITDFRLADDIVENAKDAEEADVLVDRLDTTTARYKMEIGPNKTKVMTNRSRSRG